MAKYAVQQGPAKDLSFRIRQAGHPGNADQAEGDQNEVRLIVDYPISILRAEGQRSRWQLWHSVTAVYARRCRPQFFARTADTPFVAPEDRAGFDERKAQACTTFICW